MAFLNRVLPMFSCRTMGFLVGSIVCTLIAVLVVSIVIVSVYMWRSNQCNLRAFFKKGEQNPASDCGKIMVSESKIILD